MIENLLNRDGRPHWFIETKYKDYKKFLNLFDLNYRYHIDFGGSKMNYKWDYSYPAEEVDPNKEYLDFLEESVKSCPVSNCRFTTSWWVDYPVGSYSVMHQHGSGPKKFTAVMFLTDKSVHEGFPHAGNLYALPRTVKYREWAPVAGDVIILDGDIYHGTYPNLDERKVFVVDYEFE